MTRTAPPAGRLPRVISSWELPPAGRWIAGIALVALVVLRFKSALFDRGDFDQYPVLGEAVLAGTDIYDAKGNNWPPFFSLPCVPLAFLARAGLPFARSVWYGLNLVLLVAVLGWLAPLAAGEPRRWTWRRAFGGVLEARVFLPLLLCLRFVQSNFDTQQVDLVIFSLTAGGLVLVARGRAVTGGTLVGVAAALKVMPVLFIPYLLWRGPFGAGAAALVALVACSLLPAAVFGPGRFLLYLKEFHREAPDGWGVNYLNQSVYAMADRFLGHGVTPLNAGSVPADVLQFSGSPAATAATILITLAFVGWVWLAFGGRQAAGSRVRQLEVGVMFISSAIFCPLTWKAYLLVLLWPLLVLVAMFRRGELDAVERRVLVRVLATYAVLALLPTSGLVGKPATVYFGNLSTTTVGVLVLLGGLLWLRRRRGPAPAGPVAPAARGRAA